MALPTRARIAGILAISLLMLSAPGALAGGTYQPDAQIRQGSNPSYLGVGFNNTTGTGQHAINSGAIGQKLTFFIKIVNPGEQVDAYKVKRSAGFTNGYRVRYYDAAGHDVTWQVTLGTFTTPTMGVNDTYVMRATVKIQAWATACSSTSRLITVTSVSDSFGIDAVRFTAELASNCPPVAFDDLMSITEDAVPNVVSGNVLTNDTDPDGDTLTVTTPFVSVGTYGTWVLNADGSQGFTLNNAAVDFLEDGSLLSIGLNYSISDGHGGTATAVTRVSIHGVSDPCVRSTGC